MQTLSALPKISVVIPVYKVEKYLKRCLDSVINQTYKNIEIICIDDGSPDNCPAILDEYAKKDNRIKVVHQKNMGLSGARNAGIDLAKGEYIGFVDSDDYIAPDMYEKLYNALIKEDADISMCNFTKVYEVDYLEVVKTSFVPAGVYSGKEKFELLANTNSWWVWITWNKLYKKSVFNNIKFPVGEIYEDFAIITDVFLSIHKLTVINDALYFYFQRVGSIMHDINNRSVIQLLHVVRQYERCLFFKKNFPELLPFAENDIFSYYNQLRDVIKTKNLRELTDALKVDKKIKNAYKWSHKNKSLKYLHPFSYNILEEFSKLIIFSKNLKQFSSIKNHKFIMINTSEHVRNLGDTAILSVTENFIKEATGETLYILETNKFFENPYVYKKLIKKEQILLFNGGGNFGDKWPQEDLKVQKIARELKDNKIIIFPQTVSFNLETENGKIYFENAKDTWQSLKDITVVAREEKSCDFLKKYLPNIKTFCVPDMVALYDAENITSVKRKGILLCLRTDSESILTNEQNIKIKKLLKQKFCRENIFMADTHNGNDFSLVYRNVKIKNKLKQFKGAKLVVTDRLHAMLFSAITNTPCIAFGNSTGKTKGVYEWVKNNEYIKFVNDLTEFEIALNLLDINKVYKYDLKKAKKDFKKLYEYFENL